MLSSFFSGLMDLPFCMITLGDCGAVALLAVAVVALIWALGGLSWMDITENTATPFELRGSYRCMFMSKKDHGFNGNGKIERGDLPKKAGKCKLAVRLFGGLVVYCSWFVKPAEYKAKCDDDIFGAGHKIFLNERLEEVLVSDAETKEPESVPLTIRATVKLRIVDPYLYYYVADKTAFKDIVKMIHTMIRAWVSVHNVKHVQESKSDGTSLKAEFLAAKANAQTIQEIARWGVEVDLESLSIMDVAMKKEDQDALAEVQRQEWQAKGVAVEIIGSMLEMEAVALGLSNGTVARDYLKANKPERLKEIVDTATDTLIQRKLGAGYHRFDVPGLREAVEAVVAAFKGTT